MEAQGPWDRGDRVHRSWGQTLVGDQGLKGDS